MYALGLLHVRARSAFVQQVVRQNFSPQRVMLMFVLMGNQGLGLANKQYRLYNTTIVELDPY
jgi:hypothetical protein